MVEPKPGTAAHWIFAHVNYSDDACLIWPFSFDYWGRGQVQYNKKFYRAHRLMCELVHGPAPNDKPQSLHSCGNGHLGCVNPKHLSWGTMSENMRDKRKHGTQAGAKGNRTWITPEIVADLRASKGVLTVDQLCVKYGLKEGCVRWWQRHTHMPLSRSNKPSQIRYRQKNPPANVPGS